MLFHDGQVIQADTCDIVAGCSGLSLTIQLSLTGLIFIQADACDVIAGLSFIVILTATSDKTILNGILGVCLGVCERY